MDSRYKMTVSQTPSIGLSGSRAGQKFIFKPMTSEAFWNSRAYFPVVMGISAVFLFTGQALMGMLVLAAFATYMQFTCRDLMAAILPAVLFLLLGTKYYDNLGALLAIWWILPPFIASLVYNFLHWPIRLRKSACWKSLLAVSIACAAGGVGIISAKEYFSLYGFMYGFGLGGGMLLASVLYGTNLARPRSYDVCARFSRMLYCVGIFTGLVVVNYYIWHFSESVSGDFILYIHFRNYLTTMLILALPMPFRLLKSSRIHVVSILFIYTALLLTGSRSGLVFGTLILFTAAYFTFMQGKKLGRRSILLIVLSCAAASVLIFVLGQTVLNSRLVDGTLFPMTDSRIMFLKQSVLDFLSNPLTGIGIANMRNSKIFLGVGGSMVWYHNYFAQIVGSMGLVGIFAYGWLLRDRFGYLRTLHLSGESMLALAYLGMLMVSMTNPGEFCPLPNEFLIVLLFDVAECVRASHMEATVSDETSYVTWAPTSRRVKLGVYSPLSETVSVSSGEKSLVLLPDYANTPAAQDGIRTSDKRSGEGVS